MRATSPTKAPIFWISAPNRRAPMAACSRSPLAEEQARLAPVLPARGGTRRAGLDRHHEGRGRRLGARTPAPRSSTTSGACSAIPTWRAWSPRMTCRSSSCTTASRPSPGSTSWPMSPPSSPARSPSPMRAGIARNRIVLDPGIGFGKTPEQSLTVHRPAGEPARASACRFWSAPRASASSARSFASEPDQRLGGSIAAHLLAVQNGAAIIRTHDVAPTLQALRIAAALRQAGP